MSRVAESVRAARLRARQTSSGVLHAKAPRGRWIVGCALAAASVVASQARAEDISALATRLAELRGEVESLSDELAARKNEEQEMVRSYGRQKSELELETQREQTRVEKVRQATAQKKAEIDAQRAANQSLAPSFEKQLEHVRSYVKGSLPFRTKERLSELDKIEEQYKGGLLAPGRALNRLWGFVEDELRMTRESGLFSQPVEIDGKPQLADVIRVGMVMMYYRTSDGHVGRTSKSDGGYQFSAVEDEAGVRQVRELFETFKKQIRVGFFELPNALPAVK